MDTNASPVLVEPGDGRVLRAFGEEIVLHLAGAQTGGKLASWTEITPPGGGPPPHYHANEDELFFVREGRLAFFSDNEWKELGAGGVAFMPRTSVHTFKNVGDSPSRMLVTSMPSGVEAFFARCAEEFAGNESPDMQAITEIGIEHGVHFLTGDDAAVR